MRKILINTCVFGTRKMYLIPEYLRRYPQLSGLEILPMFGEPDFGDCLSRILPFPDSCRITLHEPVFYMEHTAPQGSEEGDVTEQLTGMTADLAEMLGSTHLTMHLSNGPVFPEIKQTMIGAAREAYARMKERFGSFGCEVLVENTGLRAYGNVLLEEDEFIDLSLSQGWPVLIDVGHAHANGWNIPRVIEALKGQIRAYHLHNNDGVHDLHSRIFEGTLDLKGLLEAVRGLTPAAEWIIEYIHPELAEKALAEDLEALIQEAEK